MANKSRQWYPFLGALLGLATSAPVWADDASFRSDCNLAGTPLTILRTQSEARGPEITLIVDGKSMPVFSDLGRDEYEVGEIVSSHCGKNTFTFTFNYGSPYLKSLVYWKCGHRLKRLDFAEKNPPTALSRCSRSLFAVFPDEERGGYKLIELRHEHHAKKIDKSHLIFLK